MDFFRTNGGPPDEDPFGEDRPEPPERPAWEGPPESGFGRVVALDVVVARTAHAFIGVPSATVHRGGVALDVVFAARRANWPQERWEVAVEDTLGHRGGMPPRPSPGELRV